MSSDADQAQKVRQRFTSTADAFTSAARGKRGEEAEHFAECVIAGMPTASAAVAVDVATGPGTFARPLAARVERVVGVDLTPAMIEKAREEAARASLTNIEFILGDALALPFADTSVDVVVCGYSIHHMPDAKRVISEMTRILRPGGRLGIADLIVGEGANSEANNGIERARDASHTEKLTGAQYRALFAAAGLRQLTEEVNEQRFDFNDWMRTAGSEPGDSVYVEVRRRMEDPAIGGAAGYQPHKSPNSGALKFMNTTMLWVGEKVK